MNLITGVSPHIKTEEDTKNIMLDMIIALAPATVFGVIVFGISALLTVLVCVAAAVITETLCCYLLHKPISTLDYSAIVTGLLLALSLPAGIPLYIAVLGSVFAIIVAKLLFGGIGKNLVNPAIFGRVFLLSAFPSFMTTFKEPFLDVIASATPLTSDTHSFKEIFFGVCSGSIGETSALLILFGGVYLVARRVITVTIPLSFIITSFIIALIFGLNPFVEIVSGGLLFGAVFMATDYVTSPITKMGKTIFGIGCGIITMLIRLFSVLPEGVSYGILLMNLITPLIDRYIVTCRFDFFKLIREGKKSV